MSQPVVSVGPETTITEAANVLVTHGISALPVLDREGGLVGIVSEADLLPTQTRPDPRTQAAPLQPAAGRAPHVVGDVMTRRVITLPMEAEVSQAARMMLEADVKRIPVVSGRLVVGIVSRRDVVKLIARRDAHLAYEILRRLDEAGVLTPRDSVEVAAGIATIRIGQQRAGRRLAHAIALAIPGVLEVRFAGRKTKVASAAGR